MNKECKKCKRKKTIFCFGEWKCYYCIKVWAYHQIIWRIFTRQISFYIPSFFTELFYSKIQIKRNVYGIWKGINEIVY